MTRVSEYIESDILVSGAGAAGLTAALSLARAGFSVICAGRSETVANGRTVALFEGSIRFLQSQNLWQRFAQCPAIAGIRLIDDTGLRLPVPPLTLRAGDIGLDALGANVETDRLVAGLIEEASHQDHLRLTGTFLKDFQFDADRVIATDNDGHRYSARLIVAADGRRSSARLAAGIGARMWSYPQVAMTALLSHRKPHNGISTEFHTRNGPCTLVPLAGTSDAPHRSSLVWLMAPQEADRRRALDDAELARELTHQTRAMFGRIQLEAPRGFFPMGGLKVARLAGPRIVLMGEAAHAFPPLAAQGLNLSLRDVAELLATLTTARANGLDIGALATLAPYERARRRDVALRTNAVDVLNRSLMTDFAPVDVARGLGAVALRLVRPLRQAVMREGILPPSPAALRG